MVTERIAIVGSGRMGQGLGAALARAGYVVTLIGRRERQVPEGVRLHVGPWPVITREAPLILLATPDDVIQTAAQRLVDDDGVLPEHVVCHLSGLLDHHALEALRPTGAALGSFHPLKSVVEQGRHRAADFSGASVGIEGDARAVEAMSAVAERLEMTPIHLPPGSKPAYHAAAVLVANYTVVLVDIAERIARDAGLEQVAGMYQRLLEGAVANLAALPPNRALTGPIRRGDANTVAAHLAALPPSAAEVYRLLGLQALAMARAEGLASEAADRLQAVLAPGAGASQR
jgi:predicted short-subunit dehydrogenase-like oxidoreductase (DUF2520 family)